MILTNITGRSSQDFLAASTPLEMLQGCHVRIRHFMQLSRTLAEAAKGSTDMSKNIGGVAEAAHATTVGATETSKSAQSLEKMSNELRTLISQFRF